MLKTQTCPMQFGSIYHVVVDTPTLLSPQIRLGLINRLAQYEIKQKTAILKDGFVNLNEEAQQKLMGKVVNPQGQKAFMPLILEGMIDNQLYLVTPNESEDIFIKGVEDYEKNNTRVHKEKLKGSHQLKLVEEIKLFFKNKNKLLPMSYIDIIQNPQFSYTVMPKHVEKFIKDNLNIVKKIKFSELTE